MKRVARLPLSRIGVVLIACGLLLAAFSWRVYTQPIGAIPIENPYAVCADGQGGYCVLDQGRSRVLLLTQSGAYRGEIFQDGVSLLAADDKGGVYMAAEGGKSLLYAAPDTRRVATRFTLAQGRLSALTVSEGALWYAVTTDNQTELFCLADGQPRSVFTYSHVQERCESAFSISVKENALYLVTLKGELWRVSPREESRVYAARATMDSPDRTLARAVSVAENGDVYFVDGGAREILRLLPDGSVQNATPDAGVVTATPFEQRSVLGALCALPDGVALVSRDGLVRGDAEGRLLLRTQEAVFTPAERARRIALWAVLGLCFAALLALCARGLLILRGRKLGETAKIALGVGAFAAAVSLALIATLPGLWRQSSNAMMMDKISSLARMVPQLDIAEDIGQIDDVADYGGERYESLTDKLDVLLDESRRSLTQLYYIVYTTDGDVIITLADSTGDSQLFDIPQKPFAGSDTQVYNYDQHLQMDYDTYSDATGDWTFSVVPVEDDAGNVTAIVELGANSRDVNRKLDAEILELIATLLTLLTALFMGYSELIHFLRFRQRRGEEKRNGLAQEESVALGLRPLTFLLFTAFSLQSAFVPILAARLYTPDVGIPKALAAALPLSASLLTASLFGLVGGRLLPRMGARRLLLVGQGIVAASFFVIGISLSFWTLTLGRLMSGVGMGLTTVSLSTMASLPREEELREKGFTCYNAGMMTGLNLGMVLGAQCVGWVGYEGVYLIAACVLLCTLVWTLWYVPRGLRPMATQRADRAARGTPRFLCDRSVWSFLLLVFLPYTVASYYLYYFFPLFADANGMSQANIGRFYLLAGLIVAGCGPRLTAWVRGLFGAKGANVLACVLYAALLLLFATFPSLLMAAALVVLLSVVDSFGFSVQNIYYSGLPAARRYGAGNAMGVFSLAENASQTAAPFLFAAAVTLGESAGMALIGGCCVAFMPAFWLLSKKPNAKVCHAAKA